MDNRITKFIPNEIMINQDLIKEINNNIAYGNIDIRKILQYIPKVDKKQKQKDIKFLYESLCCENKKNGKNMK